MRRKGGAFVLITRTRCSLKLSPFRHAVTGGELRGFKVNHKPDRQEQPKENLVPGVTAYAFQRAEYHSLVKTEGKDLLRTVRRWKPVASNGHGYLWLSPNQG